MSSFIGIYGGEAGLRTRVWDSVSSPSFLYETERFSLLATDSKKHTFHSFKTSDCGFLVSGIGISTGEHAEILNQSDWKKIFQKNTSLRSLNGHFATVEWNKDSIKLQTDPLGLRNIFIAEIRGSVIFSSRMDLLLPFLPQANISWEAFGSNWMAINPFSNDCFIEGIEKLSQGGTAEISNSGVSVKNTPWTPTVTTNYGSITDSLISVSLAGMRSFSKTSLGLSGGLDSRVLLALLIGQEQIHHADLYTIDIDNHPDVKYSVELNSRTGAQHDLITPPDLSVNEIGSKLKELSIRTMLSASVFQIPALEGLKMIGNQNRITIDGAFGEIARRRFLRSLELKSGKAVLSKSADLLLPYLTSVKADIFNQEITSVMHDGMQQELRTSLDQMPDPKDMELGDWLDLFTIRTRVPNLVGASQEYIDEHLFHYMPFLQQEVLNSVLFTSINNRKNAKELRSLIQKKAPALTSVPLVKGDDVYPYLLTDLPAMVWMKAKRKLGLGYTSDSNTQLMIGVEELLRDLFSSKETTEFEPYDQDKIKGLINDFYTRNNHSRATELGWLLGFELFRTSL